MKASVEGRVVTLPPQLAGFFDQDVEVEVSQYAHHLELWRLWVRRRDGSLRGAKVTRKGVFRAAATRVQQALPQVSAQPELAAYLAGYRLECLLKVAVCDRLEMLQLDPEADRRLSQQEGLEIQLQGSDGHDLALLWRLAGLDRDKAGQRAEDCRTAFRWNVNWRYTVPKAEAQSVAEFLSAADRLCGFLEERL